MEVARWILACSFCTYLCKHSWHSVLKISGTLHLTATIRLIEFQFILQHFNLTTTCGHRRNTHTNKLPHFFKETTAMDKKNIYVCVLKWIIWSQMLLCDLFFPQQSMYPLYLYWACCFLHLTRHFILLQPLTKPSWSYCLLLPTVKDAYIAFCLPTTEVQMINIRLLSRIWLLSMKGYDFTVVRIMQLGHIIMMIWSTGTTLFRINILILNYTYLLRRDLWARWKCSTKLEAYLAVCV